MPAEAQLAQEVGKQPNSGVVGVQQQQLLAVRNLAHHFVEHLRVRHVALHFRGPETGLR